MRATLIRVPCLWFRFMGYCNAPFVRASRPNLYSFENGISSDVSRRDSGAQAVLDETDTTLSTDALRHIF